MLNTLPLSFVQFHGGLKIIFCSPDNLISELTFPADYKQYTMSRISRVFFNGYLGSISDIHKQKHIIGTENG